MHLIFNFHNSCSKLCAHILLHIFLYSILRSLNFPSNNKNEVLFFEQSILKFLRLFVCVYSSLPTMHWLGLFSYYYIVLTVKFSLTNFGLIRALSLVIFKLLQSLLMLWIHVKLVLNMRNTQWQIIYSILNRFVADHKVQFAVQCALEGSITWDSNQTKREG